MRIGFLTYGLDRAPTGIGRYSVELLRALQTLPDAPEIVLLTTEREDKHNLWGEFEHHNLAGCRLLPALMTLGNPALALAARRFRLDIIHDPNGIAPFFGFFGKAKRVVTIHDAFAYVYPQKHNHLDNWRYRWMLPRAAKQAEMVLTDSQNSALDLQNYLNLPASKIKVVFPAVSSAFKPLTDCATQKEVLEKYKIKSPYLLYVGGINARKNIARLFEAFALLRHHQNFADLKLVIGGKRQWQTSEIDQTFERLKLEDSVIFTGYLDEADLPTLYSAAEVFVFPSLYEGFGLPPLEAMACGTPVVTSNTSSLPEVVGEAALTCDPYDVEAIAKAIEKLLTDSQLKAEMRQKGLERAKFFSWKRTAQQTKELYQYVLSNN